MTNSIHLIFQDCPDCGTGKEWFDKQKEIAKANRLKIVPISYNQPGVSDIILDAQASGLKNTLLFYADGNKYGHDISDFIPKPKVRKKPEKTDEATGQN